MSTIDSHFDDAGSLPPMDDDERAPRLIEGLLDEVSPPPIWIERTADAAWSLRRIDAELAELVESSTLAQSGARDAGSDTQILCFESAGLRLELMVRVDGEGSSIEGEIIPVGVGEAGVSNPSSPGDPDPMQTLFASWEDLSGGRETCEIDSTGAFWLTVPHGRRIRVVVSGDPNPFASPVSSTVASVRVATEWFSSP